MEMSLLFARSALFIALISAFEIYGETKDSRSISMVVLAFFATLFWRDWRFRYFDFFGDLSNEKLKSNRSSVFVFGNKIDSSKPEVLERDVLLDEELLRYRTQSIAGYWGVIAAFGALMHWRFGVFPYSGTVLVAFLICFPLSFATHYSQQLIPLFLSLLGVMIALWRIETPSKTLLVVYVLSTFATIAFLQNIRLNFISKTFGSAPWLQNVLKRALVSGVGFCVLVYAVTKIFPERHALPSAPPEVKSETRKKAIETVAKQIAKLEKRAALKPKDLAKAVPTSLPALKQPSPTVAESETNPETTPPKTSEREQSVDRGNARPSGQDFDPEALKKLMAMKMPSGGKGAAKELGPDTGGGGRDVELNEQASTGREREAADEIAKELSKKSPEELESLKQQLDQEIAKAEDTAKHPGQVEPQLPQQTKPNDALTANGLKLDDLKAEDIAKLQKQLANQDPKEALAHLEKLHDLRKQVEQTSREKSANRKATAATTGKPGIPATTGEPRAGGDDKNPKQSGNDKLDTNLSAETDTTQANQKPNDSQTKYANMNVNPNVHVKRSPDPSPPQDDDPTKESDRVKELALEIDKKLERLESLTPYVVFGLIGLVIGLMVVKWMRRTQKKEVVLTLTEEEKKEASDELRSIRERKLTPQQEIIETYNVMMDVLEKVQLGREEGLPARVHARDLKKRLPKMGASVFEATDGFDAALYGDLDPESDQLAKFRKSTKSVFKQFDIAA